MGCGASKDDDKHKDIKQPSVNIKQNQIDQDDQQSKCQSQQQAFDNKTTNRDMSVLESQTLNNDLKEETKRDDTESEIQDLTENRKQEEQKKEDDDYDDENQALEEESDLLKKFLDTESLRKTGPIKYEKFSIQEEDDEFLQSQNYEKDQIFDNQRIVNFRHPILKELIKSSPIFQELEQEFKTEFLKYLDEGENYKGILDQKVLENAPANQLLSFTQLIPNIQQVPNNWYKTDYIEIQKKISNLAKMVTGKIHLICDTEDENQQYVNQYAIKVFEIKEIYEREKNLHQQLYKILLQKDENQQDKKTIFFDQIIPLAQFNDRTQSLYFSYGIMSLQKYMEVKQIQKSKISENDIWYIMLTLVRLARFLSENKIFHSDIKPYNVILYKGLEKNEYKIKLGDIGACVQNDNKIISYSPPYSPLQQNNPSFEQKYQNDLFSIGRIIYEILLKQVRLEQYFSSRDPKFMAQVIQNKLKKEFSKELIEAMEQLLQFKDFQFFEKNLDENQQHIKDDSGEVLSFVTNQRQKIAKKLIKEIKNTQEFPLSFQQIYAEISICQVFSLGETVENILEYLNKDQLKKINEMEIMNLEESSIFYSYLAQLNQLNGEPENSEEIIDTYLQNSTIEKIQCPILKLEIQNSVKRLKNIFMIQKEQFEEGKTFLTNWEDDLNNNIKDEQNLKLQFQKYQGLADIYQNLGEISIKEQQYDQSEQNFLKALQQKEQQIQIQKQQNENFQYPNILQVKMTSYFEKLALLNQKNGNIDKAINYIQKGLEIREQNITQKNLQLIANSYDNLIKLYTQQTNTEQVQIYTKKYDQITKRLEQENENINQNLAEYYHNQALESAKSNEIEKAINFTKKALDVLIGMQEDENWDAVTYYQSLGLFQKQDNQIQEALKSYEIALSLIKNCHPDQETSPSCANLLNQAAQIYVVLDEHDLAETYLEKAVKIVADQGDEQRENLAQYSYNLALVYKYGMDYERCLLFAQKAYDINVKLDEIPYASLRKQSYTIGTCHIKLEDDTQAKQYLLRSLQYLQEDPRSEDEKQDDYSALYNELGYLFFEIKEYPECVLYMEKALKFQEKEMEQEEEEFMKKHLSDNFVNQLRLLAFAYKAQKNINQFVEYYIRAIDLSKKYTEKKYEEIEFVSDYHQIATAYVDIENYDMAQAYYEKATNFAQDLSENFPSTSTEKKELDSLQVTLFMGQCNMYEKLEKYDKYEELQGKSIKFKEELTASSAAYDEQLVIDYINYGVHFQNRKQDNEKAEELYKKAYALADTLQDEKKIKISLLKLNQLFSSQNTEKYVFYSLKYIEYLNKFKTNLEEIPGVYVSLGNCMYKEQNYDIALEFLEQGLQELETQNTEQQNGKLVISIYEIMNLCYEKMKQSDKAIETQMHILTLYQKFNFKNDERLANITFNIAYTYNENEKFDFAFQYLEKAGDLAEECLKGEAKFIIFQQIATIFGQRNKFAQAQAYLRKCLKILNNQYQKDDEFYKSHIDDVQSFKKNIEILGGLEEDGENEYEEEEKQQEQQQQQQQNQDNNNSSISNTQLTNTNTKCNSNANDNSNQNIDGLLDNSKDQIKYKGDVDLETFDL